MVKKTMCLLLTFVLLTTLGVSAYAGSDSMGSKPGQVMPNFTVEITDGGTAELSALLQEKELVVLNVFTTWCGPCKSEFPEMEKVYQEYSDRMVILSVSGDPDDTMEMIADYKAGNNLSFPMGRAGELSDILNVKGYPTTYFITRDGTVGFVKVGSFSTQEEFEEKVTAFLKEDYDGNPIGTEDSSMLQNVVIGAVVLLTVLLVIGRWGIFRKAGIPGWHSLIPGLSIYQEYGCCWNGWLGIVVFLIGAAELFLLDNESVRYIVGALVILIRLAESLKLSKAFGKGWAAAVLLLIFNEPGRFVLGLSRTPYRGKNS